MITFSTQAIESGTLSINRAIGSPCLFSARFKIDRDFLSQIESVWFGFRFAPWVQSSYQDSNTYPTDGYYDYNVTDATAIVFGDWYDCQWNGPPSAFLGKMQISFVPSMPDTMVYIRLFFLAQYDNQGVYKDQFYDNRAKLLKDSISSPIELNNTGSFNDVYSTQRYFKCFVYTHEFPGGDVSKTEFSIPNKLRFYNLDIDGNPPLLENNMVQVERGTPQPELASNEDSLVRFRVKDISMPPGWTAGTKVYLYIIKTSGYDNNVIRDWNYSLRYIEANSFTADLPPQYQLGTGDIWIAPNTTLTPLGGGIYEVTASLDHTRLTAGNKYRFIHIWRVDNAALPTEVYPLSGNIHDFSFISDEFECKDLTPPPAITGVSLVHSKICDYLKCYGGALRVVPGERLISKVRIGFNQYNQDPDRQKGMYESVSSVRISMYLQDSFDTNIEHYLYDTTIVRTGGVWQNPSNIEIYDVGADLYITFGYRTRYDTNSLNLYTWNKAFLQKTAATKNQDWRNKTVFIKFEILLNNLTTDGEELQDLVVVGQKLYVKNFDTTELTCIATDDDGFPVDFLCDTGDDYKLCFKKQSGSPDAKFISLVEQEPYFTAAVEEEDPFSSIVLPQMDSEKLYSADSDFVSDKACVRVSVSSLDIGNNYRVIGIKKDLPPA